MKVLGLDKKLWSFIRGCDFLVYSFVIIIAMNSQRWFYQESSGIKFYGGLLRYETQDSIEASSFDCSSYSDCSSQDSLSSDFQDAFESLYTGGLTYIVLNSLAIAALLVGTFFFSLEFVQKLSQPIVPLVCMWVAFLLNTIGYIVWATSVKLVFSDDCKNFLIDSDLDRSNSCAGSGGQFGLALTLILLLEGCFQSLIFYKTRQATSKLESVN